MPWGEMRVRYALTPLWDMCLDILCYIERGLKENEG
jgi:hypothetical protein